MPVPMACVPRGMPVRPQKVVAMHCMACHMLLGRLGMLHEETIRELRARIEARLGMTILVVDRVMRPGMMLILVVDRVMHPAEHMSSLVVEDRYAVH